MAKTGKPSRTPGTRSHALDGLATRFTRRRKPPVRNPIRNQSHASVLPRTWAAGGHETAPWQILRNGFAGSWERMPQHDTVVFPGRGRFGPSSALSQALDVARGCSSAGWAGRSSAAVWNPNQRTSESFSSFESDLHDGCLSPSNWGGEFESLGRRRVCRRCVGCCPPSHRRPSVPYFLTAISALPYTPLSLTVARAPARNLRCGWLSALNASGVWPRCGTPRLASGSGPVSSASERRTFRKLWTRGD